MIDMHFMPTKVFLTRGIGTANSKLASFEQALRDAGIAHCNLVYVSSIFPPNATLLKREDGVKELKPGQIVFTVLARLSSKEPSRKISASIGLALPKDPSVHGYLSEHHTYGHGAKENGDFAEDLAASMLASTLGIEFNPDDAWDTKEDHFKMSGQIIKTTNITSTTEVGSDGKWKTVISAAVLLP